MSTKRKAIEETESIAELVEKLSPGLRLGWARTQCNTQNQELKIRTKLIDLVTKQESFNMIILGPPGCGKNTFFEACVNNLKDNREFYKRRRIIRLNGLVCGRQLKASINEIFRQLKVAEEIDVKGTNFDDRLDSIMDLLRSKLSESGATERSKIYIFLLDNLEYFCEGTQLLLYNLFDACASGKGCLGVIGMTSRIDIIEMFEKRVKSRFSHRIINLTGGRSFEEYLQMASVLMNLQERDRWNLEVVNLMKSTQTQKVLRMLYETDKSIERLCLFLYEVAVSSDGFSDFQGNIMKTWEHFNASSKVQQCLDLPVFDMMLILAIRTVHQNPFQFETLWEIVKKLAAQFKLESTDLRTAFQNLESSELILPIKTRGGSAKLRKTNEGAFYRSNMSYNDLTNALKAYPNLPSSYQELMAG